MWEDLLETGIEYFKMGNDGESFYWCNPHINSAEEEFKLFINELTPLPMVSNILIMKTDKNIIWVIALHVITFTFVIISWNHSFNNIGFKYSLWSFMYVIGRQLFTSRIIEIF